MNQIGIACEDTRISAIVNGVTVLNAFDAEYTDGSSYLGVGSRVGAIGGLTATFDNLTVADLGSSGFDAQTGNGHALDTGNTPQALTAPPYDPEAAYVQSAITSVLVPPVTEPIRRTGPVAPNHAANVAMGVQLDELYAELTFWTPQPPSSGTWKFGFCFWVDPAGSCTDFFVESDGLTARWGLGTFSVAGGYTLLEWGDMPAGSVDLTPGAHNVMAVVVYQGAATLGANGQVAASFMLNSQPAAGDVIERIEYSNDDPNAQPLVMTATDVAVWDLSDQELLVDYEDPDGAATGTEGVQSVIDRACRYGMPVKSADGDCGGTTTA
jgi:hypothetical protein